MEFIKRHARPLGKRGVTAVEYGIMAALIATALVTSVGVLRKGIGTAFSRIASTMSGAS